MPGEAGKEAECADGVEDVRKRGPMLLWTGSYYTDTLHFSATEHGAYLLLLMEIWQSPDRSIPDNDKVLARYARCSPRKWAKIRPIVMGLLQVENGRVTSDRHERDRPTRPAIPAHIREAVWSRDGMRCRYCGTESGQFHLDHRLPWSRGGKHSVENLCVACARCNYEKGALTVEEWLS